MAVLLLMLLVPCIASLLYVYNPNSDSGVVCYLRYWLTALPVVGAIAVLLQKTDRVTRVRNRVVCLLFHRCGQIFMSTELVVPMTRQRVVRNVLLIMLVEVCVFCCIAYSILLLSTVHAALPANVASADQARSNARQFGRRADTRVLVRVWVRCLVCCSAGIHWPFVGLRIDNGYSISKRSIGVQRKLTHPLVPIRACSRNDHSGRARLH